MFYKHVHFFKTAFIQQHGYTFTGCVFALIMLFGNCFFSTAKTCCSTAVNKFFYFFKLIAHLT